MNKSIHILRNLAKTYRDLAHEEINNQRALLHRNVNDLKSSRPVVLIDEVPWHEMNIDNQLTLVNTDPVLMACEDWLRKKIFQYKYFPGDMILTKYLPVGKVIEETDIGVQVNEDIVDANDGNHIISHEYHDQLQSEASVHNIVRPIVSYNELETLRRYNLVAEAIGDILPIRLHGIDIFSVTSWDNISRYRGVTPLLMDLIDRPEHSHKIMRKLTDVYVSRLEQYEALNLFESQPYLLHCTPILTDDLRHSPFNDSTSISSNNDRPLTRKDVWGRGAAQILASVSKDMRDEFDITYMQETIGQCGLAYYGCCEPLDTMIDIVEKLPNLRKISITPWADVNNAAEIIGNRYVLSSKPNPASVAVSQLNQQGLHKELDTIVHACKTNNCHADIVLKDISTCHNNPENIFNWEKIAMKKVMSY